MANTDIKTVPEYTIKDIEALSEDQAKELSEESMVIKGHNIYFIDFPGYFGYSACVFCNGHHIHYANDYELHHKGRSHEDLKNWYIETMNHKLYTEEELSEPIKSYDDYESKRSFLQNYYGMRGDYISAFMISPSEKEEKAFKRKVEKMYFNPVCYAYYDSREFVEKCVKLHVALTAAKNDTLDNFDYWVDAIYTEMCNHEYGINWQRDYDTLSAFGNVNWYSEDYNSNLEKMFNDVGFNKMQREAYIAAKQKYYKIADEKGWF